MASSKKRFGILVGGGPAPGINGVIAAATIAACKNGFEVVGFMDGFKHLIKGDVSQVKMLTIPGVTRFFDEGGSILRTSRENPTKVEPGKEDVRPTPMEHAINVLRHHDIGYMITIGGDDTCFSASKLAEATEGEIKVVHVPKTIDNDLPLDPGVPTFGFETARHYGTATVLNLIQDARTTPRWYIVVAMGRTAGHLALGIAKAASAPLAIVPEEFPTDKPITFKHICDIVEGAIIKRKTHDRPYGVAILAEGLMERMTKDEIEEVFGADQVEYDQHGHPRLDDLNLGPQVRDELRRRMKERLKMTFISKNLGYELRCAPPIPFDSEYTRNLGFGAVDALLDGFTKCLITFVGGTMKPTPFNELPRTKEGRLQPRLVDVEGESYHVAREFMIRLDADDFKDPAKLKKLADAGKLSVEEFRDRFEYLVAPRVAPKP
jgi:ATP-dependent phosphofructokinase / diphosphate-dependent phosphofructokinase